MPPSPSTPATYFVTSATWERRPFFRDPDVARLLVETLQHYRREGRFKLHAFVVMPDHVHLLLSPVNITIERAAGLIKGGFSHRLPTKYAFWQKGFHDRRVRDLEEFLALKAYIHENPVRARLAGRPEEYAFSSATRTVPSAAEAESLPVMMRRVNPSPTFRA